MFSSEQLAAILAALPDLVFVLTRSGRYAEVFGGADLRCDHDAGALVGRNISDVLKGEKAAWCIAEIGHALDQGGARIVEYSLPQSEVSGLETEEPAEPVWFEGRIQRLGFQVMGEDAVLWVASNVTEHHVLEARLRALSETDELTGLWNRRHFEKRAKAEMHRAQRYGHPVSVLIFDIDHFKVINDTCGHQVGDEVLVELARLVRGSIRDSDSLTRWGGEEFTVLMSDTAQETAGLAAEKLRRTVAEHAFVQGLKVTISIGVAQWSGEGETLHALIARADDALYIAKREGRDRCVLARPDACLDKHLSEHGMPLVLHWRLHYESGHALIDAEHRELFERAGDLLQMAGNFAGEARAVFSARLDALLELVVRHFASEEQILAGKDWAGLAEHRAEHQQLLFRVGYLRKTFERSGSAEAWQELVRFIAVEIVVNHMLRADRMFFPVFHVPANL